VNQSVLAELLCWVNKYFFSKQENALRELRRLLKPYPTFSDAKSKNTLALFCMAEFLPFDRTALQRVVKLSTDAQKWTTTLREMHICLNAISQKMSYSAIYMLECW